MTLKISKDLEPPPMERRKMSGHMKVKVAENIEVDAQELITGRTLLCAISRYGKSYCARRICEQIFGHASIAIIDVEGEYSTLLEAFPFLIIGRDVPIEPEAASFLADEILKNKLSFIIDGSNPDLDIAVFQEFVAEFVTRFIAMETKMRVPYFFVLEEADQLMPEKGIGTSLCLEQLTRLVAKGGKRGLGSLIITQRPAFVSKRVISQASNKLIGRTEWPDDIAVLKKFGQIPESADIKNLKQGYFYAAGPFISKPQVIHIGPVQTTHLGSTPAVIPPTPSELTGVVAALSAKLPTVIEEMKPVIPKTADIEARIKTKFEKQWQVRLERVEKQRDIIKNKVEAKYETEIADLNRKLDDAVRHATLKGGVSDLLTHPLVKKNLSKLNEKQHGFVELLETKGPQDAEHCSLFLEIKPASVPTFVHEVNRKFPKLIENQNGRYVSRLPKLFPVTEEAQAEAKESEKLRALLAEQEHELAIVTENNKARTQQILELGAQITRLEKELMLAQETGKQVVSSTGLKDISGIVPVIPKLVSSSSGTVELAVKRTLTDVKVEVYHEVLEVDESTWEGKLCARGLEGFFDDSKGIGKIMAELVRRYGVGDSGGNRSTVNDRLTMLVSKGILDRTQEQNQWVYTASAEFKERVRKK